MDALSRREVNAIVLAIVQVESDMLGRLHQTAEEDAVYKKLVDLVWEGMIQMYWLEQDLFYAKGGRICMLKGAVEIFNDGDSWPVMGWTSG